MYVKILFIIFIAKRSLENITECRSSKIAKVDLDSLVDNMLMYYQKYYPYDVLCNWLSYGNEDYLKNREFSVTTNNDIYMRFLSFSSSEEMKKHISNANPQKIDIGAIYNLPPKNRQSISSQKFKPEERELVFDIDLTDYDDVRSCCKEAEICSECWSYINTALKILRNGLDDIFGFKDIFYIFSGRRGIHIWVCDERARLLSDEQRASVAEFFNVERGKGKLKLHPFLRQVIPILEDQFKNYGMNEIIGKDEIIENYLKYFDDDSTLREKIKDELMKLQSNLSDKEDCFNNIKDLVKDNSNGLNKYYESLFDFTYTRLDINVSKLRNHLLKAPFCVHPKTGKICVAINPDEIDQFDAVNALNVNDVCRDGIKLLQPSINMMNEFINRMKQEKINKNSKNDDIEEW